jgi:hypothetical protein
METKHFQDLNKRGPHPTLVRRRNKIDQYVEWASEVKQVQHHVFLSLFVIGLFNNNGYVMVGSGSSDLAKSFKKESMMPMF